MRSSFTIFNAFLLTQINKYVKLKKKYFKYDQTKYNYDKLIKFLELKYKQLIDVLLVSFSNNRNKVMKYL